MTTDESKKRAQEEEEFEREVERDEKLFFDKIDGMTDEELAASLDTPEVYTVCMATMVSDELRYRAERRCYHADGTTQEGVGGTAEKTDGAEGHRWEKETDVTDRQPASEKICPLCDEVVGGQDADEATDYAAAHPSLGMCCVSCLEDYLAEEAAARHGVGPDQAAADGKEEAGEGPSSEGLPQIRPTSRSERSRARTEPSAEGCATGPPNGG